MGETVRVLDPYNMYYTPDGKYALVVAEQRERLELYDAKTMKFEQGAVGARAKASTTWTSRRTAGT